MPVHADPRTPAAQRRGPSWLPRWRRSSAARSRGSHHLEVETYTWSVLPGGAPTDDDALAAGLASELAWVHAELVALGLTPL